MVVMTELSNEQRRQLIDLSHVFAARRNSKDASAGHYRWVTKRGHDYLMRKHGGHERSLGRRSTETEAIMAEHERARQAYRRSGIQLDNMARVNKALRINRVPATAAQVLRALDDLKLLGESLFVVGTNAMYAYEMRAGVLFESAIIATSDFDLLWDARDRLRLVASKASAEGILGILRSVDPTFSSGADYGLRAQNADGYFVDLFCPNIDPPPERITPLDIDPIPTEGMDWLTSAKKVDEMVVGEDGYPARMVCVDPRIFALHKVWLSKLTGRPARSRPRDLAQARVVARVAKEYLNLKLDRRLLRHLPAELAESAETLRQSGARGGHPLLGPV
jgi:hypothetical protein